MIVSSISIVLVLDHCLDKCNICSYEFMYNEIFDGILRIRLDSDELPRGVGKVTGIAKSEILIVNTGLSYDVGKRATQ